jgi:hypothetical protein
VRRAYEWTYLYAALDPTSGDSSCLYLPLFSTNPGGNYLEVRLTTTDSQWLSGTVVRDLRSKTVEASFETQPTGFKLTHQRRDVPRHEDVRLVGGIRPERLRAAAEVQRPDVSV